MAYVPQIFLENPNLIGLLISVIVLSVTFYILGPLDVTVLDPEKFKPFKLIGKTQVSPNTNIYRFEIPDGKPLGLPIGKHISIAAEINGKTVQRSYTPITSDEHKGFFDLLIKTYPAGNISQYVAGLKIGDSVMIKGPKGQMDYKPNLVSKIGMIAGGTGIAPMLQIIKAVLSNPEDKTELSLLFANVSFDDILLKDEIDELAKLHPDQFKVEYVLNNAPPAWSGATGFVTDTLIKERLPAPAADVKILLCGPPPMIKAMKTYLVQLGYEPPKAVSKLPDQVFAF